MTGMLRVLVGRMHQGRVKAPEGNVPKRLCRDPGACMKGNRISPKASVIMLTSGSDAGRQAETAGSAGGNGGALPVRKRQIGYGPQITMGVRHKP